MAWYLKLKGALILCIVAVLAKTCLEKFTLLKYAARHTVSLPVKTLVRHISQTIKRIEKQFSLLKVHFDVYLYFAKNLNFDILIRSNMNGNLK